MSPKLSVGPAGGELTFEECEKFYRAIRNHFQKDKVAVCLGLEILSINIQDWYRDNLYFSERMINGEEIKYGYFFKYTYKDERTRAARGSLAFINLDLSQYARAKIKRQNRQAAIKTIEELGKALSAFMEDAIRSKKLWLRGHLEREIIKIDREPLLEWIESLKSKKQSIENLVTKLKTSIKCEPYAEDTVIDNIRRYITR